MTENRSLSDVLNSPRQTATRVYSQGFDAIHTAPDESLIYKPWDGSLYAISPSVTVTVSNEANGKTTTHEFAVAAIVPNKEATIKQGCQLSLIASGNVALPIAYIDESATSYPYYSPEDDRPVDPSEVDLILDKIYDRVNMLVEEQEREQERQRANEQEAKRDRRKRVVRRLKAGGYSLIGLGIVAGVIFGFHQWSNGERAKDQQQQAAEQAKVDAADRARWDAIAAFDGKGIVIKSDLVLPGESSGAPLDREAMAVLDEAPPLEDLLDNPRRLTISAGSARKIATLLPGKGVHATTNAPKGHVVVNVLEDGAVWLMALPDGSYGPDATPPSYSVLVQSSNTTG